MKGLLPVGKIFTIVLLLLISFTEYSYSQIEIIRNITIEDGLAYSQVTDAFQDSRGIIWIGTTAGLSEWDSHTFNNYFRAEGLPSNFITSICEDENGKLIIGTINGIVYLNKDKFSPINNSPSDLTGKINRLFLSSNNRFFILTDANGLWEKKDSIFVQLKSDHSPFPNAFLSVAESPSGEILFGTKENGIYLLNDNTLKKILISENIENYPVKDILLSPGKSYFSLYGFGIEIHSNSKIKYLNQDSGLPDNFVNDLTFGTNNEIYLAGKDGVTIVRDDQITKKLNRKNGLSTEFITKTFCTNDNLVFFLSEGGGIYLYRPELFKSFNMESGLLNNTVWAIEQTSDGKFYFATDEGVSIYHNGKFESLTTQNGLGDDLVIYINKSKTDRLFFGTYGNGVTEYYNGKFKIINKENGLPGNSVWYILNSPNGEIYFITHRSGIGVYKNNKIIKILNTTNGLPSNLIISGFVTKDGTLLVSVENEGVYKLVNDHFEPFTKDMDGCYVWSIFESSSGQLYFGTNEHGLFRCNLQGKRDTIGMADGLSSNAVVGITEDRQNNLILATDYGVNVIKFSEDGKYSIRKIFKQSGLASSECNQGALFKDSEGKIWIGTIGGVTQFSPQLDISSNHLHIIISSLTIFDKEIFLNKKNSHYKFNYDENYLKIGFSGINYSEPDNIEYRYRLIGIEENWNYSKRNYVQYTNIPSGSYLFEVEVCNEWGMWSASDKLSFSITLPFWKSWWFILIIFVLALTIVFLIVYWRMNHLLKIERLRSNISADLHDEIGSGLSEISILSDLLVFNIKNEIELDRGLKHIGETTKSLIERLSDIIWIVNPKKESIKNLILRIQDTYQEVFYHSGIDFNIHNAEIFEKLILPLEVKQNLYLITKEAVNNSLKYSGCSRIDFEVKRNKNKLCIEIRDNGNGFNKNNETKGNGLFNMKKRAEKIDAIINIDSLIEKGTTVKIEIFLKNFLRH